VELIEDAVTGQLVPAGDSAALAAALRRYVENPDLRHALGAAARRRAESVYSLNSMMNSYRELYAQQCALALETA
jgi:glycosyltransferase involved in cell wall biosynthesis